MITVPWEDTMTTFDGSTRAFSPPPATVSDATPPDPAMAGSLPPQAPVTEAPFDALESLRQQLDQREDAGDDTVTVDLPKLGWRLVCTIEMPYAQYAKWQKAAFPPGQRSRRRGPNPLDLDQAILARLVLLGTCVGMEFKTSAGEWEPLLDSRQQPVTPSDSELMTKFGQVDPGMFLRKLFGSDAKMMRGSEIVMKGAGWMEDDDEESDPTD